ncbi:GntR family transcriptional regulator [uncultured Meiothermus sp.]|jgi:DNA-binding GntR family transcriptional regulator|uniref:GntR family transcriptional regulator n=1 Tax=uncultured Meiothermus sp. TaxID=157471 RepID=UPI002620F880|nr:GntR family transcriptional regulator [uncultured Meiothermus sp.]
MPVPESAQTLTRPILRESAYQQLRDWIVQGILEPGEQLRDQELAVRLGVSRTPVREALRRLEDEGLVETAKNRWTRVKPVDLDEAEQIYPVRAVLDSLALKLTFPHLTQANLSAMREANVRLKAALKSADIPAAVEADSAFHDEYVRPCSNLELVEIIRGLRLKHHRLELTYFGSPKLGLVSVEEHAGIVEAIVAGNAEAAPQRLHRHFHNALARLKGQPQV